MVVRVRVKIVRGGEDILASALANSGYESETPPSTAASKSRRSDRFMAS